MAVFAQLTTMAKTSNPLRADPAGLEAVVRSEEFRPVAYETISREVTDENLEHVVDDLKTKLGVWPNVVAKYYLHLVACRDLARRGRKSSTQGPRPRMRLIVSSSVHFPSIHSCRGGQASGMEIFGSSWDGLLQRIKDLRDTVMSDLVTVSQFEYLEAPLEILFNGDDMLDEEEDMKHGLTGLVRKASGWDISTYADNHQATFVADEAGFEPDAEARKVARVQTPAQESKVRIQARLCASVSVEPLLKLDGSSLSQTGAATCSGMRTEWRCVSERNTT